MIVRNNLENDIKLKCMIQAQFVKEIGTTSPYMNRIIKKGDTVINRTFVNIVEALGYDI